MAASIITTEDLYEFKMELLEEIKQLLQYQSGHVTKKWLKTQEVRDILGISVGTLQNLRLKGILPYTKIGATLYYDYHDIMQLLEKNRANKNY
ncbi:MAG: helix-turn-helix domain-containing protein [Gelidibacter sp.]|nr:helix-turn-helix domain-containing protein [Gelidibacter sp.]